MNSTRCNGATGFVGADRRIPGPGKPAPWMWQVDATGARCSRPLGESMQTWSIPTATRRCRRRCKPWRRAQVVSPPLGPTPAGLPLVAACAAAGTDYADLTDRAMFARSNSIDQKTHSEAASKTNQDSQLPLSR